MEIDVGVVGVVGALWLGKRGHGLQLFNSPTLPRLPPCILDTLSVFCRGSGWMEDEAPVRCRLLPDGLHQVLRSKHS